nr:sugar kinase [Chitinophagaceae bacterium]
AEVDWFHFSAIVPAISRNLVAVCDEALRFAEKKNIIISADLNYRKKLWQYGEQPAEVMPELINYCDVVMANIWSANTLLGIDVDENIHDKKSKDAYTDHAYNTSREIIRRFPQCKTVANTFRFDEGEGIHYYATLYHNAQQYISREFRNNKIQDKAGSGDCFMAGLIFGLKNEWDPKSTVDFAAAAALGKLQEPGDLTNNNIEAVKYIMENHE